MKQFLKGAVSVVLALGLAYGWTWTGLLKDLGWIGDTWRLRILVGLSVVFLFQQVWLVLPRPVDRATVDARRPIVGAYLQGFLAKYYDVLRELSSSPTPPAVRVNLMLPAKKAKGLFGSFLKIYYNACPGGVAYSDLEKALHWKKGKGTCGWAWNHGETTLYNSGDPAHRAPYQRLTEEQRSVVGSIQSVLSVPVRQKSSVVGVLNLDSKHHAGETKFTERAIVELAEVCGRDLAAVCFPDGVSSRSG